MMAAIQVEGLRYSYGDVEAVKGISFEVAPGEILGFLGPNGAGKSTTIKMLTGQLRPAGGRAAVLGFDVTADDPQMQARIGVCFEEKNLYLNMTGKENLEFFASLYGIKDPDALGVLRRVGLAKRHKPKILGCHFSAFREDIERINGFDERYEGWGLEDDDFSLRLQAAGVRGRSVIREARALHLWHAPVASHPGSAAPSRNLAYFRRRVVPAFCACGMRPAGPPA